MITADEARRRGIGPFRGLVIVLSTYAGFASLLLLLVALWVFGGAA